MGFRTHYVDVTSDKETVLVLVHDRYQDECCKPEWFGEDEILLLIDDLEKGLEILIAKKKENNNE